MTALLSDKNLADIRAHILSSLTETLHVMFNIDVSLMNCQPQVAAGDMMVSRINFGSGDESFYMYLTCARPILRKVAEKLMSVASEVDENFYQEVVGEIANIIGNGLCSYLETDGVTCQVGFPETIDAHDPAPAGQILHVEFCDDKTHPIDLDIYRAASN